MVEKKTNAQRFLSFGKFLILALCLLFALWATPLITANELPESAVPISDNAVPAHREPADGQSSASAPLPTPETVTPDISSAPLPMADVWFDDAVFIGDSRMEGFKLYAGLPNAQYLAAVGATVDSVYKTGTERREDGTKIPIMDALKELSFTKAYIMLGLNELGWPDENQFKRHYGRVIESIREIQPEAVIYVQSILPVTAKKDAEGTYINNARVALFNETLQELAQETGTQYLDVASAIVGEDGALPEEKSADGVHLQPAPCKEWLDYIRTHTSTDDVA